MIKYRGYYIDGFHFHSKEEIDAFIKEQAIDRYKSYCRLFSRCPTMEASIVITAHEDWMHKHCGMSYAEIEDIQIEVFSAA